MLIVAFWQLSTKKIIIYFTFLAKEIFINFRF